MMAPTWKMKVLEMRLSSNSDCVRWFSASFSRVAMPPYTADITCSDSNKQPVCDRRQASQSDGQSMRLIWSEKPWSSREEVIRVGIMEPFNGGHAPTDLDLHRVGERDEDGPEAEAEQ